MLCISFIRAETPLIGFALPTHQEGRGGGGAGGSGAGGGAGGPGGDGTESFFMRATSCSR